MAGETAYDLGDRLFDLTPASVGQLSEVAGWVSAGALAEVELSDPEFAPPVAGVGAVIAIGINDAAHAAESGSEPPTSPVMFLKTPNTLGGPDDPVRIPPHSRKTDWEVELAFVIGRRAYESACWRTTCSATWRASRWPTTCRSGPSSSRSPGASGARGSASPATRRSGRGW